MTSHKGSIYVGKFENMQANGEGVETRNDGTSYRGEFLNSKK